MQGKFMNLDQNAKLWKVLMHVGMKLKLVNAVWKLVTDMDLQDASVSRWQHKLFLECFFFFGDLITQ